MFKQINIILKTATFAFVFLFGFSYALAWTAPSTTPPGGDVPTPINIGATTQTKVNGDICSTVSGVTKCLQTIGGTLPTATAAGQTVRWNGTAWENTNAGDILVNGITFGKGGGNVVSNTATGLYSLFNNLATSVYNTGNGAYSLLNNTGSYNTAAGYGALYSNTSGSRNTAFGMYSLFSNTTGSQNTALGNGADVATGALSNATAIGYNASVAASNTIQLGNTLVTALRTSGVIYAPSITLSATGSGVTFPDGTTQTTAAGAGSSLWTASGNNISNTNTANVGIGTASPTQKLEVSGNILQQNTNTLQAKNSAGTTETWMWPRYSDNVMYTNFGSAGWNIRNNSSVSAVFIQNGGNVGIGTTAPAYPLDVNGGIQAGNNTGYLLKDSTGASRNALWLDNLATNVLHIRNNQNGSGGPITFETTGGAERMRVDTAGNVGIGTATPAQKLSVAGVIQSTTGGVMFPDGTTQTTAAGAGSGLWTASGNNISNTNSANVGIGTATPGQKLSVAGVIESTTGGVKFPDGTTQTTAFTAGTTLPSASAVGQTIRWNGTAWENTAAGDVLVNSVTFGRGGSSVVTNTASGLGALAGNTTGAQNTANGYATLYANTSGSYNTATGLNALRYNTTGNANTAYGNSALASTTSGYYNNATGYQSLFYNTTGYQNTADGIWAMTTNTTGFNNTALGAYANVASGNLSNATAIGYGANVATSNTIQLGNTSVTTVNTSGQIVAPSIQLTTGAGAGKVLTSDASGNGTWANSATGMPTATAVGQSVRWNGTAWENTAAGDITVNGITVGKGSGNVAGNTAVGYQSLLSNTTGGSNTAVGHMSLASTTSGLYNAAHGAFALNYNTTGSSNTGIGYAALYSNTTGNQNTAIGNWANVGSGALTNATAIGYAATATASNQVVLGNSSVTSTLLNGNVGVGTANPEARLQIGDGTVNTANQIILGKNDTSTENYLPVIQQKSVLSAGVSNDLALGARSGNGGILFYTGGTAAGAGVTGGALGTSSNAARMAINVAGNVGIGTTAPGYKLSVIDTSNGHNLWVESNAANTGVDVNNTGTGGRDWGILSSNTSAGVPSSLRFYDWTAGADRLVVSSGGNVGIGTTAPAQKLSVAGTIESTTGGFKFPDGTTQATAAGAGATLWAASGNNIYNTNTANVGIGTATPGSTLDIGGTSNTAFIQNLATWGLNARTQGLLIEPEGNVTDDGAGNLTFGSTVIIMNPLSGSWIRVAAGTYALGGWGALWAPIPPTGTRGTTVTPTVTAWADGDRNYDGRDRVLLAQRVNFGRVLTNFGNYANATGATGAYFMNGNVGIGTLTPTAKLDVSGADAAVNGLTVGEGGGSVASNTTLGLIAMANNTTGTANTAIGYAAGPTTGALTNTTAIGSQATVATSNTIQLGNSSVTTVNTSGQLVAPSIKLTTGAGAGKVLTSDASGNGTWTTAGGMPTATAVGQSVRWNGTAWENTAAGDIVVNGVTLGEGSGTGLGNTATGLQALRDSTTGAYNTANGLYALASTTSGSYNTANGAYTLSNANNNVASINNTATGYAALFSNTTGNSNTASGMFALYNNTTGTSNTAVGYAAGPTTGALTNTTSIGNGAQATASNQVVIGNSSVTSTLLNGNVGVGTGATSPVSKFSIAGGATNSAGSRLAINENSAGAGNYFYGLGLAGSAGNEGLGLWGGTETLLPYDGSSGVQPHLFIKRNSGNVGIGTTTPATKLAVAGTIYSSTGGFMFPDGTTQSTAVTAGTSGSGTTNYLSKWTSGTGLGNSTIVNNATGTGFGTTNPTALLTVGTGTNTYPTTPAGSYIDLNGSSLARLVMNDGTGNFTQYLNSYYDGTSATHKYQQSAAANRFVTSGGTYAFYVAPTGTAGNNITWTTALGIDNSGNVGVGTVSPTAKLDVSGGDAHINGVTVGLGGAGSAGNTALGLAALFNNTSGGTANTAVGSSALLNNITGGLSNTGVGYSALSANTTGDYNTAIGANANVASINLTDATAIGYNALVATSSTIQLGDSNITGVYTSGQLVAPSIKLTTGAGAGKVLTSDASGNGSWTTAGGLPTATATNQTVRWNGTSWVNSSTGDLIANDLTVGRGAGNVAGNTALGLAALPVNTTGTANTAVGSSALFNNTTGTSNTGIGYNAGPSTGALTNTTSIGNGAQATASNQVVIGNSSVTSTLLNGNVGVGTTAPGAKFDLQGTEGLPATSGTAQNGIFRIENTGHNQVLDVGQVNSAPWATWLQSTDKANLANTYAISLNPNGGNVGIGTTTPATKLAVAGTIYSSTGGFMFPDGTTQTTAVAGNTLPTATATNQTVRWNGTSWVNSSTGDLIANDLTVGRGGGNVSSNTAVGLIAMLNNTTGTANTAVGYNAGPATGALTNTTSIGNGAQATASNQVVLGNSSVTSTLLNGNVGVGTAAPLGALDIFGTSGSWQYFRTNANGSNPSTTFTSGLSLGWNKSGGQGESNIVFGTGTGSAPRLDFGEWNGTTYATDMTIKSGGNVGIGTTAPAASLDVAGRTSRFSNFYPEYKWHFGHSTDLNWKKIADINLATGLYVGTSLQVDILDANGNFGNTANLIPLRYYVSAVRSSNVQDSPNTGSVSGPISDYVRLVQTATGVYELQVRQTVNYKDIEVVAREISQDNGVTITYATSPANGTTTGTNYMPVVNGYTQTVPNLTVAGTFANTTTASSYFTGSLGVGTSAPVNKLTVVGDVGATGDVCTALGGGLCLSSLNPSGTAFTQANIPIAASGKATYSVAHGLGATPSDARVFLVCGTAEAGYAVGDVIDASNISYYASGNVSKLTMWMNATNVGIAYDASNLVVANKTTGALAFLTPANWTFTITAKK